MKKGDKARIYKNPITREGPEGIATLQRFITGVGHWEGETFELWEVIFEGEEKAYPRRLSYNDLI